MTNSTKYNIVSLGEVVKFECGGTPSKANPAYWEGDIPWASVKDISGPVLSSTVDSITEEGLNNSASRLVPAGNVIIPTRMALGRAAINTIDVAINQDLRVAYPNRNLDRRYLLWYIIANARLIESLGSGATVKGITLDKLRGLQIPLPPLAEQKRIAAILDKADAIRRKLQQSLRLSDDFLRSVFLDMFGSDKSPKCERVPLGTFLEFMTSGGRGWSQYYAQRGARFIRSLDVQMNEIGEKDVAYVAAPNNAEAKRTRVSENDVLLTITGSLIGRVARVPKEHAGAYISQHVAILRLGKGLNPEFLARFLSMDEGQRLVQKSQYGQTKPGLNFDQIRRFKVTLPSVELQKRFVEITNRMNARLMKGRALMCDSEALFSSLQQRAFRGEL